MPNTITLNGTEFPTTPQPVTTLGNIAFYEIPNVSNMWRQTRTSDGETINILHRGNCVYCNDQLWSTGGEDFPLHEMVDDSYVASSVDDPETGDVYAACYYCAHRASRKSHVIENGRARAERGEEFGLLQWPEEILAPMTLVAEQARARRLEWDDQRPVPPVQGAYVYLKGDSTPHRFDRWTRTGRIRFMDDNQTHDPDQVEVAIPIVFGTPHQNVVILPGSSYAGQRARITRYAGVSAYVSGDNIPFGTAVEVNYLAVLVPPLNPEKESLEDKVARLERETERMKVTMHKRMVAQAMHRSWCEEFDPILVSTGLDPRTNKVIVRGTLTFEVEMDGPWTDAQRLNMESGSWWNEISYKNTKVQSFEVVESPLQRALS